MSVIEAYKVTPEKSAKVRGPELFNPEDAGRLIDRFTNLTSAIEDLGPERANVITGKHTDQYGNEIETITTETVLGDMYLSAKSFTGTVTDHKGDPHKLRRINIVTTDMNGLPGANNNIISVIENHQPPIVQIEKNTGHEGSAIYFNNEAAVHELDSFAGRVAESLAELVNTHQ